MKLRTDFVTNSSSSSYIICFARISDEEKAKAIIDKYNLRVFNVDGVNQEKNWCGELGADFCGAIIYGVDEVLKNNPDSNFIIIEDSNDGVEDEWGDVEYDYDFLMNNAIDEITEENGFADIEVSQGEGRDG